MTPKAAQRKADTSGFMVSIVLPDGERAWFYPPGLSEKTVQRVADGLANACVSIGMATKGYS